MAGYRNTGIDPDADVSTCLQWSPGRDGRVSLRRPVLPDPVGRAPAMEPAGWPSVAGFLAGSSRATRPAMEPRPGRPGVARARAHGGPAGTGLQWSPAGWPGVASTPATRSPWRLTACNGARPGGRVSQWTARRAGTWSWSACNGARPGWPGVAGDVVKRAHGDRVPAMEPGRSGRVSLPTDIARVRFQDSLQWSPAGMAGCRPSPPRSPGSPRPSCNGAVPAANH